MLLYIWRCIVLRKLEIRKFGSLNSKHLRFGSSATACFRSFQITNPLKDYNMLVTKENFEEVLPAFDAAIEECDFVSFDLEMSGIMGTREHRISRGDDPNARYAKVLQVASRYAIIQFGICLWTLGTDAVWTVKEFTFFLFPSRGADLCMAPDSIEFLRKNNMDFGMWFKQGIPFTDKRQTAWLTKKYSPAAPGAGGDQATAERKPDIVLTKPADVEFIDRQKAAMAAFMGPDGGNATELVLEPCNPFLRRCVYQWLEQAHPDLTLDSVVDEKQSRRSAVRARKMSAEQKEQVVAEKAAENLVKLKTELGFTQVYALMCASNKPIVGHNCFADLLFVMAKMDGQLPATLKEFKEIMHEEGRTPFGAFLDTKFFAEAEGLLQSVSVGTDTDKDTALGPLYKCMSAPAQDLLKVKIVQEEGENLEEQLHSAGYDAYITGYCFAAFLRDTAFTGRAGVAPLQAAVDTCANYLFMMISLFHMDLRSLDGVGAGASGRGGNEHGWLKLPPAATLYYLTDFPPSAKEPELYQYFTETGLELRRLKLIWIDGTSCYVLVAEPFEAVEPVEGTPAQEADPSVYISKIDFGENTDMRICTYEQKVAVDASVAMDAGSSGTSAVGKLVRGLTPPFVADAANFLVSMLTSSKRGRIASGDSGNKRAKNSE